MPAYDTWKIVNTTHTPHTLGQFNSVCTISNGYLGLKGNLAEQRDGYSPVTLINGVYDELDMFAQLRASREQRPYLDPRYFDAAGKSPAVANLPNPLFIQVFVAEREVSFSRGGISDFQQVLDLATGVYRYSYEYRDGLGRTTRIEMERFASLKHPHRVFMRYSLTPVDHEALLRVHSGISGEVYANPTGERQFRVTELWTDPPERCRMVARTPARRHDVRLGVVNLVRSVRPAAQPVGVAENDAVYTRYEFAAGPGETITLERHIALTCSEDLRHRVVAELEAELEAAKAQGFDAALDEQREMWSAVWQRCDVRIDGDDPAQLGLRFCLYHLLAAAPRFTDRLSVPVKLLTGEYYQGNTFYDTDLYIVPFYAFTLPRIARTCLDFRSEGLRPAREAARNLGHKGAKIAWQAGPRGEECLGRWWRFPQTNVHINAAVAYALMHYVWATDDERYLYERGVDVLVETARFYASRVVYDAPRDRYDLHDVAGPDEGHCESSNNFYTNYLASCNLRWATDTLEQLAQADPDGHAVVTRRLALGPDEPDKWRHVAERLTLLFDPQTKVYEQCQDFFKLKPRPADLLDDRKAWFVTVAPYQALNQPDVVMALVLFRDEFGADVRRANWEFYKDKSLNLSSMSFALNAIMAADVGDLDEAYQNFIITTGADLDEGLTGRKDTYAGLHGTACGGAWLAAVFGFGGVCLSEKGLRINPNLPPRWTGLRFNLVLRGVVVNVAIDREEVMLNVGRERRVTIPVTIAGEPLTLTSGQTYTVRYRERKI
ncbi:MAG: glycoside hydrolase family 65 protein [Phycisphaerae bacterium]|nr:glycoside hydrolase family 65 protein [Phycisphaerae bacterium]